VPQEPTHFMSTVKVGPKGQIVIPKDIRDMFGIEPGDSLIIMADSQRGIALHRQEAMERIARAVFEGQAASVMPDALPGHAEAFAGAIIGAIQSSSKEENP